MNIFKHINSKQKKCVFQSNDGIMVFQHQNYRWVLFNDLYIQTMINIKKPTHPILPYLPPMLNLVSLQQGDICLLGLGGGGLVHALNASVHKITVVEKFPEMIEIAKNFFFIKDSPNITIYCECAADFLKYNKHPFQHIVVDLGDAYGYPEICQTLEFFQNAFQSLNDQGMLILNLSNQAQVPDFLKLIYHSFHVRALPIFAKGNWLLVATKHAQSRQKLIEQLQHQQLIKQFSWDAEFGEQIYFRSPLSIRLHQFKHNVLNIFKKEL